MSDISADTLARALYRLGDCIRFYERVSNLPDCNTCGKSKNCGYRPDWGETTRINCPLWVSEKEVTE